MTDDKAFEPWQISATGFPGHEATGAAKFRFCVGFAILAPSPHNSQPWLFRLRGDGLELHADRTRSLPVVDHNDRELTISCGAALFNLRVALRHFGYMPEVALLPDPERHDLLARVRLGQRRPPAHPENVLFAAITKRRTHRGAFEKRPVEKQIRAQLAACAAEEQAWFHIFSGEQARHAVADLVAEGDRAQFADKRFRRELASWIHANRSLSHDGMPGYSYGFSDLISLATPFFIRTFDRGKGVAAKDHDLAEHSPLLCAIGTKGDTPLDWMHAGQALGHILLHGAADGLQASFLNQPIEVDTMRPRLARLAGEEGQPQVLLRMGYGEVPRPTPRRGVKEVLREG